MRQGPPLPPLPHHTHTTLASLPMHKWRTGPVLKSHYKASLRVRTCSREGRRRYARRRDVQHPTGQPGSSNTQRSAARTRTSALLQGPPCNNNNNGQRGLALPPLDKPGTRGVRTDLH